MVNGDRTMRCRSICHTSRSLHPPVRSNSKFLRSSIRLSMLACNSHLREKLKNPKPSLREDISPPRYTANNEKCSESQSGSASGTLCLAPFRTLTHALPVFMQVIYLPGRSEALRFIKSAKSPAASGWGFCCVYKAQCFCLAKQPGAIGSSPGFSRVFSRYLHSWQLSKNTLLM